MEQDVAHARQGAVDVERVDGAVAEEQARLRRAVAVEGVQRVQADIGAARQPHQLADVERRRAQRCEVEAGRRRHQPEPRCQFAAKPLLQPLAADADYAALAAQFSAREMVDVTMAINSINSWNRLGVGFRKMPAL